MSASSRLQWFRAYTEMVDDERLCLLSFEDRWHYVALLCLKHMGIIDEGGHLLFRKAAVKMGVQPHELEEIAARLAEVDLVDKYTLQPSMHLVAGCDDLRPPASVWREIRNRVFRRDDYTCTYCGVRGVRLECDHIIPISRGGSNEYDNLTTACFKCNRAKAAKTPEEWRGD